MSDREELLQTLDIVKVIMLFIIGCLIGKYVMDNVADTWLGFNGPVIGILSIGELIWWKIRKRLTRITGR